MPLDPNYKDPLTNDGTANPAQSVGPIVADPGMPPAAPPVQAPPAPPPSDTPPDQVASPAPEDPGPTPVDPNAPVIPSSNLGSQTPSSAPIALSDVPLTPDGKSVDYVAYDRMLMQRAAQQVNQNQVTQADLQANQQANAANTLIAGLARASAAVGNQQSTAGETAKGLIEGNNALLNQRGTLASQGYNQLEQAYSDFQKAPLQQIQLQQALDSTDPNSQISQFARSYYQQLVPGKAPLPDNMTAADIGKFAPDIVKTAQEQANRDFQARMQQSQQAFQSKEQANLFNQESQKQQKALEQSLLLSQLRGQNVQTVQATANYNGLENANQIIEGVEKGQNPYSNPVNYAGHFLPQALKSNDLKSLENAENIFVDAAWKAKGYPRAPTPEQVEHLKQEYFTQPTDNPDQVAQKAAFRQAIINQSKAAARIGGFGAGQASPFTSPGSGSSEDEEDEPGGFASLPNNIPTFQP